MTILSSTCPWIVSSARLSKANLSSWNTNPLAGFRWITYEMWIGCRWMFWSLIKSKETIRYISQTAVLSCRRKSVDHTEMIVGNDRNRESPIIWEVIEKTRSAEKRILFVWLRGRFSSSTQMKHSHSCWAERVLLTYMAPIYQWFEDDPVLWQTTRFLL